MYKNYLTLLIIVLLAACSGKNTDNEQRQNMLMEEGSYPQAICWQGHYYFTKQPTNDTIRLWKTDDLSSLAESQSQVVFAADSMQHIWSPELHRINSKWYIYFEADHGNTDDHQIAVLENTADDPMKGKFRWKGYIRTNDEWNFGIHPTSIVVGGQQYLLWSGWQQRRAETETQCIYIARMENPWTLASERVMLSQPDHEWERQWINPDGSRSAYPIFVNENPEAFVTTDGRRVCVCYSASGIWTVYNALGMLYANADADLLDPQSWTKSEEPLFRSSDGKFFGTSNIFVIPPSDNNQSSLLLYEAKWTDQENYEHRSIHVRELGWTKEGLPDFGQP